MHDPESLLAHAGFVRGVARGLVVDENRVDDIVQETWLSALRHPPRHRRSIRGWLGTIATNATRSTMRSEGRRSRREEAAARPEAITSPAEIVERRAMIRQVVEAVERLEEPYASTVILRYYEDLGPGEIAERQGIPVETVRTRLKRAHKKMRAFLDRRADGDRESWVRAMLPLAGLTGTAAGGASASASASAIGESVTVGAGSGSTSATTSASASASGMLARLAPWLVPAAGVVLVIALGPWGGSEDGSGERDGRDATARDGSADRAASSGARGSRSPARPVDGSGASGGTGGEVAAVAGVGVPGFDADTPGALEVVVRWPDGSPAAGVRAAVGGQDLVDALGVPLDRRTDGDGRFRVEGIAPGMAVVHFDRAAGFGAAEILPGEVSRLDVTLPPGAELVGHVADREGRPIPGAEILLCREPWDPGAVLVRTDERGRFRCGAVSVGGYVGARAEGFAPAPTRSLPPRTVREVVFDFELEASTATVGGTVRDPSGRSVPGAPVRFEVADSHGSRRLADGSRVFDPPPLRIEADREGRFDYTGFGEGRVAVIVEVPGFPAWIREVVADPAAPVFLDVDLARGTALEGRVTDASGSPVSGAVVRAATAADRPGEGPVAVTADDGSYRIDSLATGEVRLSATGPDRVGRAESRRTIPPDAPETLRWDAELEIGRSIRGRVVAPDGRPLAGYEVHAGVPEFDLERFPLDTSLTDFSWLTRGERGGYFEIDQLDDRMLRSFRRFTVSGANGAFTLSNCADRSYPLEVYAPDGAVPVAFVEGVRPDAGEIVVTVDVGASAGAELIGTVVGSDGQPIAGAVVRARAAERHYLRATGVSDASGAFRVGPLAAGEVAVTVASDAHGRRFVGRYELRAGTERDLGLVRLEEPGAIEVRLRRDGPEPVAFAVSEGSSVPTVWLFDETRSITLPVLLDGDVVRGDRLAPGRYTLCIHGRGSCRIASIEHTLDVGSGTVTREEVVLRPGRLAAVRVLPASGHETVAGKVDVTVTDERGTVVTHRRFPRGTGESALAFDLVLDPGDYIVVARTESGLTGTARLRLAPAAADDPESTRTLEIRLSEVDD